MTTALDVVTRALRKVSILAIDDTAPAEMAAHALDALNDMVFAWKLAGVDTSHTALVLSDAFPLADEFVEGTVYNLASRLSPDYQAPAGFDADDWFRRIQAAYMTIDDATMPAALTCMPSQRWRY